MKKIAFALCLFATVAGCNKVEDFLDKPPGVDIDENVVFSSRVNVDQYIATMYQFGVPTMYPIRPDVTGFGNNAFAGTGAPGNGITSSTAGITDEAEASESFGISQAWNNGAIQPTNILAQEDNRYFLRWQAVRVANIILERIDAVPNIGPAYAAEVKGEAMFIRALNYFDMLKRYGGVPLVMKRLSTIEESRIPRATFEETVNAIIKDCDDAIALLPPAQPSAFVGRAHDGAALALKARALLYAASPQFNNGTPYLSMGADDKLICYGNYDLNRWRLAAAANKAVLDWAAGSGFALVDDSLRRRPLNINMPGLAVSGNYRTQWEVPDNPEMIFSSKLWGGPKAINQFPWQGFIPRTEYVPNAGGFWVANSPTFNFVRTYEDTMGNVVAWNPAGGNDLLAKYASLDFRFHQTIVPVGGRLHANATRVMIAQGTPSNTVTCDGGHWQLKGLPDATPINAQVPNVPVFRLNEFYLNYAECLIELNESLGSSPSFATPALRRSFLRSGTFPAVTTTAYDCINKVRLRSFMPPIANGMSQSQLRDYVRKERFLEMSFEDNRLWDVRRWMIAENEGVMNGKMFGLEITRLNMATPFPTAFSYRPFDFEPRTFPRKLYLHPFPENEVLKGNLKQNPGW